MRLFKKFDLSRWRYTDEEKEAAVMENTQNNNLPACLVTTFKIIKLCMIICIPVFAFLSSVNIIISIPAALVFALISFFHLKKEINYKIALVPFICMASGILMGRFFILPLIERLRNTL